MRDRSRDHRAICCLLLDSYNDFAVPLAFLINNLGHATSPIFFLWSVRWCVQVWILLCLVLHFELGEECLFKLCLLRGAYRLPWYLLRVIELVEKVLIEVVSIERPSTVPAEVHVFVGAICTLMSQT